MPNLKLKPSKSSSVFRKVAKSAFRSASEATMYGTTKVDMTKGLEYMKDFKNATGKKLTVTHLVAKGIALAMREVPEANAVMRFGRIYLRDTVTVSMAVLTKSEHGKSDLSLASVVNADELPLAQFIDKTNREVKGARQHRGARSSKARHLVKRIPGPFIGASLRMLSFATYTLNLDLKRFGIPNDPFGSVVVTNVGMFGLSTCYAPLMEHTRCPMMITVGAINDEPVVDGANKIVVRPMLTLNVTIDHRFIDGIHAAQMTEILTSCLRDPAKYFGQALAVTNHANHSR